MNNTNNLCSTSVPERITPSFSNYIIQHTPRTKKSLTFQRNNQTKINPSYDNDTELDTRENSYNTHKEYSTASIKYLCRELSCTTNDFYQDAYSKLKDYLLDSCQLASSLDFSKERMHIPRIVKASHTLLSKSVSHISNTPSIFIPYNRHKSALNEKYITFKQQETSLKPKTKSFNIISRRELLTCIGNRCRLM